MRFPVQPKQTVCVEIIILPNISAFALNPIKIFKCKICGDVS